MSNKHVMITGGMGFIGHHLAQHYLHKGFKVTIVDNLDSHINHAKLTKYRMEQVDQKGVDFIHSDCNMSFTIKEKMRFNTIAPRSIIHLASYPNQAAVARNEYGAASSMIANVVSTAGLAKQMSARYVFVSSSMAYGNFTQSPMPEDGELSPVNLYGMLKLHGEEIAKLSNGNTVVVRPSAVYGPGDNANRVLGHWIKAALNNDTIVVDDPTALLDFTYVLDAVAGIAAAEEHGSTQHAYNITRGQGRSLGEAALLVRSYTGSKSVIEYDMEADRPAGPVRGALDIRKANAHLGYNPKIDLIDGLQRYVQWMKNYSHVY